MFTFALIFILCRFTIVMVKNTEIYCTKVHDKVSSTGAGDFQIFHMLLTICVILKRKNEN